MTLPTSVARWFLTTAVFLATTVGPAAVAEEDHDPLQIVVMDPLSDRLACDCVAGYAQRKYDRLGRYLEEHLGRPVEIVYSESLAEPSVRSLREVDLVFGKFSVIEYDARQLGQTMRPLAMLSGADGEVTQTGLFVVRANDSAQSVEDLDSHRMLFGPKDSDEKHAAALATCEAFSVAIPAPLEMSSSCNTAALAVVENEADAAVVSGYAMPLLEGCGTIDAGALRIVGRTDPVPFIAAMASESVDAALAGNLTQSLLAVSEDSDLLTAMQSKHGFVRLADIEDGPGWPDWRGPDRDGLSRDVPKTLPKERQLLWSHTMTGPGMSGLAVAGGCVITADKSLDGRDDVFRCLDADTGRQIWKVAYPAPGKMDFTNSPRANPVVHEGLVYLLGAYGQLHCVKLDSGEVVWSRNLWADFAAEVPSWGFCSTPLVVDDKLIVNPGAESASILALDRRTGELRWASPGQRPGYGSFVLATLGGVRQVVGHDAVSLGGWDPQTGKRLWKLIPEWEGDFNVPTPLVIDGKLLVSTENNGTRLYGFDSSGEIRPEPLATNEDLVPDTSTPVHVDGLLLGGCFRLVCLDVAGGLNTIWECDEDPFGQYASIIGGNGRFLVTTQGGSIHLLGADREKLNSLASLELFPDLSDTDRETWSHPALVGNRLYIRNFLAVYCFLLPWI